jgi:hypothetical protein
MTKALQKIELLLIGMLMFLSACKKADEFPVVPVISFNSLTTQKDAGGYDVSAKVVISFTDGDGDIGYYPSGNGSPYDDANSPYYYNFIVKMFEKTNGNWVLNPDTLSGRMPYITPDGSNKALKGDIAMDLFLPPHKTKDTLHYDIFIYDRALHQSNTITTPDIVVTTH